MENRFKQSLLDKNVMSITWELVPGRGAREKAQEHAVEAARVAAQGGRVHALTLTDNPGGNPAILSDYLGTEIIKLGIEPLVHFTCKDKNRNQIESQLYALDRAQVRNLLIMTGDYPVTGFQGRPRPVYDLDPVHTLQLITEMNDGLEVPGFKGPINHQPSDFFSGCAVSPFKQTEAEQMVQYYKLKKKLDAGAQFVVPQLGYDMRKFHEIQVWMRTNGYGHIPLVGNLYVLSYGAAKLMNQNKIPGCVVTDKLLAELEAESKAPDKGKEARMLRSAKMYAVFRGMGFDGVHIGGHGISYQDVEYIIDKGEELSANWQDLVKEFDFPMKNGFYVYEKDEKTGLNTDVPVQRRNRPLDMPVEGVYKLSRVFHHLMFEPGTPFFGLMRSMCKAASGSSWEGAYHKMEHMSKVWLFDCKDCGDCGLTDLGYVCPMSQCPKNQRNGACGGSYEGWCEIYPNKKKCAWVRAYTRLKKHREEEELNKGIVPPPNWDFHQTSSWINFFLGKDHSAKRFNIQPVEKKKK